MVPVLPENLIRSLLEQAKSEGIVYAADEYRQGFTFYAS